MSDPTPPAVSDALTDAQLRSLIGRANAILRERERKRRDEFAAMVRRCFDLRSSEDRL